MSLGVAGFPDVAENADELMAAAESRLAAALAAGGDRGRTSSARPGRRGGR